MKSNVIRLVILEYFHMYFSNGLQGFYFKSLRAAQGTKIGICTKISTIIVEVKCQQFESPLIYMLFLETESLILEVNPEAWELRELFSLNGKV